MEKLQVHNWFGDITSSPYVVTQPESVEDLIAILKDTENYPSPVRAVGSNHSTTPCGVAQNGTLVVMRKMDRIIEIREDTVTVQAGALYIDVAQELQKHNLQFYVNVVIGNLTVGSAACCGTKDASMPGEFGQICSYVSAMKMVTPSGEIVEVTEEQPELLQVARSSYGLFGIVYEVTFRVKPLQSMAVYHKAYSLDEFAKQLPVLRTLNESMMLYINPFLDRITVEFRKYHGSKNLREATTWQWELRNYIWKKLSPYYAYVISRYVPIPAMRDFLLNGFNWIIIVVSVLALRGKNTIPTAQQIKFPEQAADSKFTFSFWAFQEENYIDTLRAYFKFCHEYYHAKGYRSNMISVGYRVDKDISSLLSYSSRGTVITIDPVSTGNPGWEEFLAAYNEFCSERGGTPLFNQTDLLTRSQIEKAFEDRLRTLESYRERFDPAGRLLNDYFKTFLYEEQYEEQKAKGER